MRYSPIASLPRSKRHRKAGCTVCHNHPESFFCLCADPLPLMCANCAGKHITKVGNSGHQTLPLKAIGHYQTAGYIEDIKQRGKLKAKKVESLRENLKNIDKWKMEMFQFADESVAKLIAFRNLVDVEMKSLQRELAAEITIGLEEFKDKFYDPSPVLTTPVGKVLWNHDSAQLLTCHTDFPALRQAFEAFLYSVDVCLHTVHEEFSPRQTITAENSIVPKSKVHIYLPLTFIIDSQQCKAALEKFGECIKPQTSVPTLACGPIKTGQSLYIGEWNAENKHHGWGTELHPSGAVYSGQWRNGEFHGHGRYFWPSGTVYEGEFRNGSKCGFGVFSGHDGSELRIERIDDLSQCFGVYRRADRPEWPYVFFGKQDKDQIEGMGAEIDSEGKVNVGTYSKKLDGQNDEGRCFYGQLDPAIGGRSRPIEIHD